MNKLVPLTALVTCLTLGNNVAVGQETTAKPMVLGAIQENSMISGELVDGRSKYIIFAKAHEHPYTNQILVPVKDGKFQLMLPAGHPEAYMLIPEENFGEGSLQPFVLIDGSGTILAVNPTAEEVSELLAEIT